MKDRLPKPTQDPNETIHPKVIVRSRILLVIALVLFVGLSLRILLLQTAGYGRYRDKVI